MTQEHPITPPPEIVRKWQIKIEYCSKRADREAVVAKIFQLGADMELEACCEWLERVGLHNYALRTARRPKPPSLKELALEEVGVFEGMGTCNIDIIRRALEMLPNE